ncbi:hypothetical protein B0H19DRAFT_1082521 [Mycena capillaripes]|nr:hypothetical protein B0H19DRAFT_1082521 [Mycena capillaripes]
MYKSTLVHNALRCALAIIACAALELQLALRPLSADHWQGWSSRALKGLPNPVLWDAQRSSGGGAAGKYGSIDETKPQKKRGAHAPSDLFSRGADSALPSVTEGSASSVYTGSSPRARKGAGMRAPSLRCKQEGAARDVAARHRRHQFDADDFFLSFRPPFYLGAITKMESLSELKTAFSYKRLKLRVGIEAIKLS